MAKGFSYYMADTDRFQDIKIKRLKKAFGCDGYAVYQYILNETYRENGVALLWSDDRGFDCAEYWNVSERKVEEILKYCVVVGLFDSGLFSRGIISSVAIQKRYIDMCKRMHRSTTIADDINLLSCASGEKSCIEYTNNCNDNVNISLDKNAICQEDSIQKEECQEKTPLNKIKEKKIKEKEIKEKVALCANVDDDDAKSNDEFANECNSDVTYCEALCMNLHINIEEINSFLTEFNRNLIIQGAGRAKNIRDYKAHFANWLRIQLSKKRKNDTVKNSIDGVQTSERTAEYAIGL